ncbi:hypothetical protein [Aureispira sp. CCB-E]|uniref:hypothetical protein n=1 Tax=Aureispira sp. CCB-E TaxID=3051121 RepID=UPI002868F791|nr:hypothetical protein [Aureispira sp. CCB-E]WMX16447.1 hypothetical protein QP953_08710 [Aureispira sp. CCB-E]
MMIVFLYLPGPSEAYTIKNSFGNSFTIRDSTILLENESFKFVFNTDTEETWLYYTNCKERYSFGRIVGRFGMEPEIKIDRLDSHNMGIFLIVHFYDMGIAVDAIICYSFNTKSCILTNIGSFPEVGIYKLDSNKLTEALSYDYQIIEGKIILEEIYKEDTKSSIKELIIRRRELKCDLSIRP